MKMRALLSFSVIVLSSCTTLSETSGSHIAPRSKYVSMGSSFAAGPGLASLQPGTPERCHRSTANYATQVAMIMGLTLVDVSCGGAKTTDILRPWNELPAQIDAVTPDTRLVTVTIGGNDLDYVLGLAAASCRARSTEPATPCRTAHTPVDGDYQAVENRLREIALQVRSRAPNARLIFIQYLTLVPTFTCESAQFTPEDASFERGIGLRLAEITRKVASETRNEILPMDTASRDHTACSQRSWSNGMPLNQKETDGISWHPNAEGMEAIASLLVKMLRN